MSKICKFLNFFRFQADNERAVLDSSSAIFYASIFNNIESGIEATTGGCYKVLTFLKK